MLVIVYWLLIVVNVDQIIVLDVGIIVECGIYIEFFDKDGLYVLMWVCQCEVDEVEEWLWVVWENDELGVVIWGLVVDFVLVKQFGFWVGWLNCVVQVVW